MAIKTRFKLKQQNGTYEAYHFETDASQVITNSNQLFCSQTEKNTWNAKETTSGAQAKADSAKNSAIASAKSYTDSVAGGKANTSHNHTASNITSLTSYAKPTSTSAISAKDSLLTAIGKLEKGLDGKQASGSYAAASHTHSNYASTSHNHDTAYLGKSSTAVAATKLATPRTINGVAFDGTANITITANPNSHTHNYEPVFTKNTAFNKNFGTSAGTVAEGNHSHSGYAASNHSHSNYALTSHNHDSSYLSKNGGTVYGQINADANSMVEMHYKASGENLNAGLYLNKDGRVGIYDWKNSRAVFQYNSGSNILDFSPTCIFYGKLRANSGVYMGDQDVIYKSGSVYYFDIQGHWRNSQLQTGQFLVQPWSTEGTALCVNKDGERTNGRTDLTIVPSTNNYGIFGRSTRYWYIAWAAGWRNPSYRESKYDISRTDENRLYNYVKDLNIYNYRRISGNEGEEKKPSDYRGDLQMGAMINELPFEVVDYDTEHGEGKGIDLYSYSSMIGGALKVAINKLEKLEEENELLKNKLADMEEKINGLIQ